MNLLSQSKSFVEIVGPDENQFDFTLGGNRLQCCSALQLDSILIGCENKVNDGVILMKQHI